MHKPLGETQRSAKKLVPNGSLKGRKLKAGGERDGCQMPENVLLKLTIGSPAARSSMFFCMYYVS
jgi:hypothetical protein